MQLIQLYVLPVSFTILGENCQNKIFLKLKKRDLLSHSWGITMTSLAHHWVFIWVIHLQATS